jgi:hypothetical protein
LDSARFSAQFENGVFTMPPKPADAVAHKQGTKIEVKKSGETRR